MIGQNINYEPHKPHEQKWAMYVLCFLPVLFFFLSSKQQKERIQVKIKVVKIKFVEFVPFVVKFLNFLLMPVGWWLKVKLLVLKQARLTKAEVIKHTKIKGWESVGLCPKIEERR
jgi:hypothetical protein